jgi:hypothetical protein
MLKALGSVQFPAIIIIIIITIKGLAVWLKWYSTCLPSTKP